MKTVEVESLTEAVYYIVHGAEFSKVRQRKIETKKPSYRFQTSYIWYITLENVREVDIEIWKRGKSYVEIKHFMLARYKLKKKIRKELGLK